MSLRGRQHSTCDIMIKELGTADIFSTKKPTFVSRWQVSRLITWTSTCLHLGLLKLVDKLASWQKNLFPGWFLVPLKPQMWRRLGKRPKRKEPYVFGTLQRNNTHMWTSEDRSDFVDRVLPVARSMWECFLDRASSGVFKKSWHAKNLNLLKGVVRRLTPRARRVLSGA